MTVNTINRVLSLISPIPLSPCPIQGHRLDPQRNLCRPLTETARHPYGAERLKLHVSLQLAGWLGFAATYVEASTNRGIPPTTGIQNDGSHFGQNAHTARNQSVTCEGFLLLLQANMRPMFQAQLLIMSAAQSHQR